MTPSRALRLRRATGALAVLWALAALALSVRAWTVEADTLGPPFLLTGLPSDPWRIEHVAPSAAARGVEPGDRLRAVDGAAPDRVMLEGRGRHRAGIANRYRIAGRDGVERELALEPVPRSAIAPRLLNFYVLAAPLVGAVYLTIGLIVWSLREGRREAWALLLFCSMMAADLFLGAPPAAGAHWVLGWLTLPLIGASVFHLFSTYPAEPEWLRARRFVRPLLYALGLGVGVLAATEGLLGAPPGLFKSAAFYFTIALAGLCFALGASQRKRLRAPTLAARADFMFLGAVVSFLPVLVVLVAQNLLGTSLPWYLAFLWFVVFPLAVGYGIVRRQLFEIRSLAKSSAAYGISTLAITGLYAFLITFAAAVFSRFQVNARSPWFSVVFVFFAILAFNPLRTRMQRLVDRLFDRDRALHRQAVREISEAVVSMLSTKEIVDRILVALTDTMGVRRAMVLLRDDESEALAAEASRGDWEPEAIGTAIPIAHPIRSHLVARRRELGRSDFDDEPDPEVREACRDVFDSLEIELLVPILFGDDLLGAIAIGPKLSGERFGWDDRQLLRTLANQSSSAIENARAFDEIAALNESLERRVEERTRELREMQAQLVHSEKMRSLGQLVAGVAHELNNPIGFVHANLQLLHEYVAKLRAAHARGEDTTRLREAIGRLLVRSAEGTERVKQIVQDLRTFSRMDQAEVLEVDLNQQIERTLALMEPRLRGGIQVERHYGELPPVRCYAGQLNQVFLNLLMNACDALQGRGTICIRTRATENGVRIEFHDDGPGIPPEIQDRIFEPFFTTKPVGQGTGLGLSLSHGIVERHGGRMLVGSAPGEGSAFVIEIPLDVPARGA